MHKRIQKYQKSGVLASPSYTPFKGNPLSYENAVGNSFNNSINTLNNPINNLINTNAQNGDTFSQSLVMNRASNTPFTIDGKISKSENGLFSKGNLGNTMSVVGNIADIAGSFLPANKAYQGDKGMITQGLDSAYDSASNAAMAVSPLIGGIMKGAGFLSKGINAITGGTDGMTTTDGILSSTIGNLTGIGIVNSAFGKKADSITKDTEAFAKVGDAYGGTQSTVDDALTKSGKKYGLLSSGARNKVNNQIHNAQLQQTKMGNIADNAEMAFAVSNNPFIGMATQFKQNGGYQQSGTQIGKQGLKLDREFSKKTLELVKKRKKIEKDVRMEEVAGFQKGGVVDGVTGAAPKVTFESWYKTVPSDRNDTTSYNLRRAFELAPKEELEAWRTSSLSDLKNGKNHLNSVYLDPKTGIYEFMKSKNHPTIKYELEWYNSNDPEAVQFRNNYNLDNSGEYYKYIPKNPGKFKNGGAVNVIPDGALHKNKHHLGDIDDKFEEVTAKGIPVITEDEKGDITQHAEVEKEEIIFNLEVTKELEKLKEEGSDDAAIEAGKLLVKEILENTVDNTGLLKTIE